MFEFDPFRTVPTFFLVPAAVLGGVCVIVWSFAPWGSETKLKAERGKYHAMTELQHVAAAETKRWKAIYDTQASLLTQTKKDASRAISEAYKRDTANNKSSFAAGVVLGRALERKKHETGKSTPINDVRPEPSGMRELRDIWQDSDSASSQD